ncbi:hypothetical protein J437_LFUL019387 [Ladona fulva]|uniref:C-type lectin domain-containing protein n=1 Tax=Ladona fulva TaxID=123851 RepID=A0A8K0PB15_LADFU|nr:hypothetical protein J437_LFUL019387 [Ladona fulva]
MFREERDVMVFYVGELTIFPGWMVLRLPPPRPPSYELFPGVGYYKFYPEGSPTYYQASSTCMNEGGHLAIVNSEAEMEVIKMLYARYPKAKEWAYVGFNDLAVDGEYITIFECPIF